MRRALKIIICWTACGVAIILGMGLLAGTPANAQDGPHTHVVQPGENLFRIALNYQISVDALMRANSLQDADLVVTGQTLIIPQANGITPTGPAAASGTVTHTVVIGDTLLNIARRYGVSVDAIMQANNLIDPSLLVTGQQLVIPGATGTVDLGFIGVQPVLVPITLEQPADLGIVQTHSSTASAPEPAPQTAPPAPPAASVPESAPETVSPESAPVVASAAPDPNATAPDLGIIPPDDSDSAAPPDAPDLGIVAPGDPDSAAALAAPDLGIIDPDAAVWQFMPGILTTGGPRVHEIYVRGQALGNNPHAFSKIGDCNSEPPFFLAKFDRGEYDLGPFAYLQPVLDQFAGSFARESMAAWTGNHAWALFDATWSNPAVCQPGEIPLACELRVNRPSLVLIRLGTNEANSPQLYEASMRRIIEFVIERGVIPILGTKADRIEGSDAINAITRALAEEYEVPLWDFGRVADTLPARGLQEDGFHMTYVPPYYTTSAALQSGHSVQNLLALMALNTVWRSAMY